MRLDFTTPAQRRGVPVFYLLAGIDPDRTSSGSVLQWAFSIGQFQQERRAGAVGPP